MRRLQRAGEADGALLSEISTETSRLNGFVDNLANLDLTQNQDPIVVGEVAIDLYRRAVTKADEPVSLTPKEYAVIAELARSAGRVLSHGYLLRAVWGPAHEQDVQYLRVFVGQLRQKIERDPASPALILTEPGVGYRWIG